jgi:hypothetical protein
MRVVGFLAYLFREFTQFLKFHPRNLHKKKEFQLKDGKFLQLYEAVKIDSSRASKLFGILRKTIKRRIGDRTRDPIEVPV